jgi:murein DD-endopeptidase MepM/ murein hydrolase activator NlpD
MGGFLRGLILGSLLIAAGWVVGSIYPAPQQWTAPIKGRTDVLIAQLDLSPARLAELRASLSPEQFSQLSQDAAHFAASTGDALIVEQGVEDNHGAIEALEAETQRAPAAVAVLSDALVLCPRMTVSNAPAADANRLVRNFTERVTIQGVALAVNPTNGACLSSGFGARGSGMHKGIDLHSADGGPIYAAAAGIVIEKKYRDDYGNMLLIDHGNGVYTRYAHLSSFADEVNVGARVTAGQQIGMMGNTASYRIPVHLHYEVLLGDYANPRASFGLTPHSPFAAT